MNEDRVRDIMRSMYHLAWNTSHDRKTKAAACIVDDFGGFISGVNRIAIHVSEYPTDEEKSRLMIHAEESAIFESAKRGMHTRGMTMVAPWAPCTRCARAIIGAGIAKLITHASATKRTYGKYIEDVASGVSMLRSAGVSYVGWEGAVGDCESLMNGEVWKP